eukprot:gene13347-19188_t
MSAIEIADSSGEVSLINFNFVLGLLPRKKSRSDLARCLCSSFSLVGCSEQGLLLGLALVSQLRTKTNTYTEARTPSTPQAPDTPESKKLRVAAASPRQFGGVNVRTHAACLPTARRSMARQFEAAAPAGPSRMLEGNKAGPSGGHKTGIAWEEGETCVVLAVVDMHAQRVVEGKVENKMLFKICQAVESSGLVPGRSATGMMRMVEGHPKTGRMNYSISSKVVDDLADGPEFRQFSAPVHAPPPVQPPVALEHAGPVEMTIGKAKTGTTMNFSQAIEKSAPVESLQEKLLEQGWLRTPPCRGVRLQLRV